MPEEIHQAVEKALDLQPGLPEAYEQMGLMYQVTGQFEKALGACSLALQKNPGSLQTLYIMSASFLSLGNWTRAEDCMNRVLRKEPYTSSLYLYRLGAILDHLRKYPNATKHYRETNGVNPLMDAAIYGLVDISIKTGGDPALSRALLDTLVAQTYLRGVDSLSLYYQYAILDLYEGKYKEAILRFSGCRGVLPKGLPFYVRPKYLIYAMAYGLMKKPELERLYYDSTRLFLENLQQVSAANRDDPRVMSALGIAYAGLGFPDKAIACAEKAAGLLKTKPDAWLGPYAMEDVAFIYTRTGKYSDALKILKDLLTNPGPLTIKVLEIDPRWAPLRKRPEYAKLVEEF